MTWFMIMCIEGCILREDGQDELRVVEIDALGIAVSERPNVFDIFSPAHRFLLRPGYDSPPSLRELWKFRMAKPHNQEHRIP